MRIPTRAETARQRHATPQLSAHRPTRPAIRPYSTQLYNTRYSGVLYTRKPTTPARGHRAAFLFLCEENFSYDFTTSVLTAFAHCLLPCSLSHTSHAAAQLCTMHITADPLHRPKHRALAGTGAAEHHTRYTTGYIGIRVHKIASAIQGPLVVDRGEAA